MGLVVVKEMVNLTLVAPGCGRSIERLVVVVVPDDVAAYVRDHIGVEPPTNTVQGAKELDAVVSVKPVKVIVAVAPRFQGAPLGCTARVIALPDTGVLVTTAAPTPSKKYMASGVPVNGKPEMTKAAPGGIVEATPAALMPIVTVRQVELVWHVPDTATEVTS
jgi:hypothetical protein